MASPHPNAQLSANDITAGADVVVGAKHVVNHYYAHGGQEKDKARLQAQVGSYLKWVKERCGRIELRGIERAGGAPVVLLDLDTAYVPLEATTVVQPADAGLKGLIGKVLRRLKGEDEPSEAADLGALRAQTFNVALNRVADLGNRLVIIGGPGSGKTTVLLHMAWALAASLLDEQNDAAVSRLGLRGELPLPILVPLASFARHRRNLPAGAPAEERTLGKFISSFLIGKDSGIALPPDFFSRLLEDGRAVLLLLDGLDEVANEDERALVRQSVEDLVAGKDQLRAIVTCRTAAYKSAGTALGANFREVAVKPLDFEEHVTPMVRKAHACIYPDDPAEAGRRSDNLLREIQRLEADRRAVLGRDAERLIDSPLMVRLLIIVDYNERKLPDERAKLFEKAVNALIQVDYARDEEVRQALAANWEARRDMLQHLAFRMHEQGQDQGREIEEAALKQALKEEPEFARHIGELILHARNRGGLLEERGGAYRFIHLAFQEFLAARYLREVKGGEGLNAVVAYLEDGRLADPWWREPILLLAGYMGANAARNAREFLRKLAGAGRDPDARLAAAELAAMGALEWKESGDDLRREIAVRIGGLYDDTELMGQAAPIGRARAGRALGRLGDPREHVMRVDAMRLCWVPSGRFFMGSALDDEQAGDSEKPPAADFPLDYDYAIGQHPVTQAQYAEFTGSGGYAQPAWWRAAITAGVWEGGQIRRRVLYWEDEKRSKIGERYELAGAPVDFGEPYNLPNHPVVGITWYEALAFCEWLTARWRDKGWLNDRQRVRLPNEPEWEKAARGGDLIPAYAPVVFSLDQPPDLSAAIQQFKRVAPEPRRYPYGDKPDANKSNTKEIMIEATSPAGCFPNGASVYGCQDMSGNVWEWMRSAYGPWQLKDDGLVVDLQFKYPYLMSDERESFEGDLQMARVLRGGSFTRSQRNARSACRDWDQHSRVGVHYGFRVVVSPSSL